MRESSISPPLWCLGLENSPLVPIWIVHEQWTVTFFTGTNNNMYLFRPVGLVLWFTTGPCAMKLSINTSNSWQIQLEILLTFLTPLHQFQQCCLKLGANQPQPLETGKGMYIYSWSCCWSIVVKILIAYRSGHVYKRLTPSHTIPRSWDILVSWAMHNHWLWYPHS